MPIYTISPTINGLDASDNKVLPEKDFVAQIDREIA
jgi:hypothetical protein